MKPERKNITEKQRINLDLEIRYYGIIKKCAVDLETTAKELMQKIIEDYAKDSIKTKRA